MKRPFAIIGFSYFIMLAFLFFVPDFALPYIFGLFTAMFLASVIIKETRKNKIFPIAFFMCMVAVAVYHINSDSNIKPVQSLDETNATISGTICDIPYKSYSRYNYIVKVESVDGQQVKPFKTKLSSTEAIEGDIYDKFTGNVHFYVPQNNPAFDSQTYYRSKNIYIHAFLYNYEKNFTQKPEKFPPSYYILKLRQKMLSASKSIFPIHISSVVNSILLGEKHDLPENIKNNFDIIGAYHLLSTSAIHISILSAFCLWIFKRLKLGNRFSAALAALAVFIFMALTCFTPSVIRAGTMSIIYLLGLAIFQKPDSLNSLGIAVFLICLLSPNSAFDISLWMGVFSTLGIIIAYNPIKNFIRGKLNVQLYNNKIVNYTVSSIAISLSVWAFTLPLVAWFFKKTSLISILSNLILIPVVTVIFNLSLTIDFLSILSAPALFVHPPALICGILTNFTIYISELLAKIPFAMISLDYGVASLWAAFTALLVGVSIHTRNSKKHSKLAALLSVNLAFAGAFSYQLSNIGATDAAVINCQNGIGFVISKNGRRAAVLCLNKDSSTKDIECFLSRSYIKNMDYLNLAALDPSQKTAAKNIIKNHRPEMTVLSNRHTADINIENGFTRPVYFTGHIESSFWEDTEVSTFETDEHNYIQIKTSNVKFLIFANGGNADDIPESWKTCDFLIANGLPFNYQKINSRHYVLSGSKTDSEINIQKLTPLGKSAYSVTHQGRLYIKINSSGNYQIRRSQ